jgi:hypothetical protein
MKIIVNVFDYPGENTYAKLSKVLEYSLKKNCPSIPYEFNHSPHPTKIKDKKSHASNAFKLERWLETMERVNDDIIFLDADMLVLKDLSDCFDDDFDIGITALPGFQQLLGAAPGTRRDPPRERIPYNGGVMLARNNEAARNFMRELNRIDLAMYNDHRLHDRYRAKYAGMNQAAMGCLLETQTVARVKFFDCREWNSCRDQWVVDEKTCRILHIKSRTRKNVFLPTAISLIDPCMRNAVAIWRRYAQEAGVQNFLPGALVEEPQAKIGGAYVIGKTAPKVVRGVRVMLPPHRVRRRI